MKTIAGKTIDQWIGERQIIQSMIEGEEVFWRNEYQKTFEEGISTCPISLQDVEDAEGRWKRFASYFATCYPETRALGGILESPLHELTAFKESLGKIQGEAFDDAWLLKLDSELPISGSIKARGGIYEVLATAEKIAVKEGLLKEGDDYSVLAREDCRKTFSRYTIAVGSTGNLGLSIGLISAKLGFSVEVHMSADAREWKKNKLRAHGVKVIEYDGDYSLAVENGRKAAESNPYCHFVDDENSKTLFLGYAVAAFRLKKQLDEKGVVINEKNPLFVYLPCGVGGGPGGVAFGLKLVFQDNVHCYFAEPTHSCCMTLGMVTRKHNLISVQDFGIDNHTIADGLAVGRASGFVGKVMEPFMDGCYTVRDERMSALLALLYDAEGVFLEPSALAGLYGPIVTGSRKGVHIAWATGGGMVPPSERETYYQTGKRHLKEVYGK